MSEQDKRLEHSSQELARVERDDKDAPLYAPTSEGGVMLCLACRDEGACHLGLRTERLDADGTLHCELTCGRFYEGGPNVASGAWVAGVLNEIIGHAVLARDFAVSKNLSVVFHKPTPVDQPLIARAEVVTREGREVNATARLELPETGTLLASAEALLIRRPVDHFSRHHEWLAAQQKGSQPDG